MNRKLHAALALVAVVSFGLYILGCVGYAAWNADSTKLLVPYYAPDAKETGVVLFDLNTRTSRKLMVRTGVDYGKVYMQAQWVNAATQPFVLVTSQSHDSSSDLHMDAYLLPPNGPIRNWLMPSLKEAAAIAPFAEVNGKVIIPSSSLTLIDLQTGKAIVTGYDQGEKEIISLATDGTRVYYFREASRPAPTAENPQATESGMQFGELTMPELKRVRYFETWDAELAAQGLEWNFADLVLERGGTRFAVGARRGHAATILIFNESRLERSVPLKVPSQECRLGSFIWPSTDIALAIVGCPAGDDIAQVSLAEVSLTDGTVRMTPVVRLNSDGSDFWDNFPVLMRPSLAPNGRTVAMITTALDDGGITRDNRALFLVDLKSPDRHVRKMAIAGVTKAAAH